MTADLIPILACLIAILVIFLVVITERRHWRDLHDAVSFALSENDKRQQREVKKGGNH